MALQDIRAVHLNRFYKNLSEEGIRATAARAIPKGDFRAALKEKGLSMVKVAKLSGVAKSTVNASGKGEPILKEKAADKATPPQKEKTEVGTFQTSELIAIREAAAQEPIRLPKETISLLREYRLWQLENRLALGDRWQETPYVFTGECGGHMTPDTVSGYLARFEKNIACPTYTPTSSATAWPPSCTSPGLTL